MIDLTQYNSETDNQNTVISNMSQYFERSQKKKKKKLESTIK